MEEFYFGSRLFTIEKLRLLLILYILPQEEIAIREYCSFVCRTDLVEESSPRIHNLY